MSREQIIAAAAARAGTPYALPPDGTSTLDCSLFVLYAYRDAGVSFAAGVRTADQIRLACNKIEWGGVVPGDLLFFEQTYQGADGRATHVGISLGAGTERMWDAHEPGGVQLTDISGAWWQEHLFEARRHPALAAAAQGDTAYTLDQLWPTIQIAASLYRTDPQVLAAVAYQESSFTNWRVHLDGTGHGLFGFDDSGGLVELERWIGIQFGRGAQAIIIPPGIQIEFAARWFAEASGRYGDAFAAARAWHRGPSLWQDAAGAHYAELIRAHVRTLFGGA